MTADLRDEVERYRTRYLRLRRALHDRTTGLPAYALLVDALRGHLERRSHIGVLHVEATNLDLVETLYGWQVFDRILARVASCLRDAVGSEIPPGSLLALNGVAGDRFVVFVPSGPDGLEVDGELLASAGSAIRSRLDEAFDAPDVAGLSPRLEFRTGWAFLSENPFYRFERRIHAAVEEARTMEARREDARERAWGGEVRKIIRESAVSTVFQPVVDLGTRETIGWEALSRGPKDTLFEKPGTLFALSDRAGVSVDLDRLCRNQALLASGRFGFEGKLFLNVHAGALSDPEWGVEGAVQRLLSSVSLAPSDLVLEISERGFRAATDRLVEAFENLRALGFAVALDDVGTGYASLATLERLRPDFVKVDLTLVRGVHENLIQQELLRSLVQIAGRLGAEVVAEGVETEPEVAALRASGTRLGQGYLFARPLALGGSGPRSGKERRE